MLVTRSPLVGCVSSPCWQGDTICSTATTFRTFWCRRCGRETLICTRCDRGQQFCSRACGDAQRRERVREAGRQYQKTEEGAARNAVRQKRFRIGQRTTVTHQGSTPPTDPAEVTAIEPLERPETSTPNGGEFVGEAKPSQGSGTAPLARCHFCGRKLGVFARLASIAGRSHRHQRASAHRQGGVIP